MTSRFFADGWSGRAASGRPRVSGSARALTALSLAVGAAIGADAAPIGELIVTATRREESLQSIPASISAVSAVDLEKRGIFDFQKMTESISGVMLSRPTSAISSGLYVRGVGTAGTSPANQSVGTLVDGVYQLRQGAAFTELMDIERVEVLRGPQGTLFGRNTTAGVIRIFTADPDTEKFSGKVQGVVGHLDSSELRGLINIPLIDDKLAIRMSGYTVDRDGWTDNVFLGRDTRNVNREGYRGKLLWNVTDTFKVKLGYEDSHQEADTDYGRVEYTAGQLATYPQLVNYPVSLGKSQENYGAASDDVERLTLHLEWEFWNHTLSTISAWEDFELYLLDDRDRTPVQIGSTPKLINVGKTDSTAHEIQLASKWEGSLNYVLGYYFQNEELDSATGLYNAADVRVINSVSLRDQDSKAWFGTLFYDFNDQWRTSVGVRYTDDEKQGSNSQINGGTPSSLAKIDFDEWTYSFKLMNQIHPDLMVYLAYDKGFKSGGINREFPLCGRVPGARCVAPNEAKWDPEESYNYEIGMKSEWLDNTLRVNAAMYYQTYDDYQVTQNIQTLSNVLVMNAAEAETMGVEADFLYIFNDYLTLNGSAAYNIAQYENFKNATCTPGSSGCPSGTQDLSGRQLDHAPKINFNVGGEYRDALPGFTDVDWFSRLDVVYRSHQNLHYEQPSIARQDGYYLFNARAGIEGFNGWKVTAWVDNLFDEEYLTEADENLLGKFQMLGIERTYGITVDYSF